MRFVTAQESSALAGKLRANARRGHAEILDAVLGLGAQHYAQLLQDKLILPGQLFDQSPFVILVDRQKIPAVGAPRSWRELVKKVPGFLLIPDPRLSESGVGWLRAIFEMKALTVEEARQVTARVFPSWSAAYAAFLKGEGSAVWTYLSSEAYHRCANAKAGIVESRYEALPLSEGYPVHEEWFAQIVSPREGDARLGEFFKFLRSPKVQSEIPLRNWMFPAVAGIGLPECYQKLTTVKSWSSQLPGRAKDLQDWADRWSL